MKFRKISKLLAVTLVAVIAFSGCKKDDGAIRKSISISNVPTISTNIDATGSQAIDLLNLVSFSGKFKVDLFFPGSTPPTKVDIVVRKWNGTANNNNVKVYKANVTTFPGTYTVTAADIATLFGAPITLGDTYDFAPDIYVGNTKYEAFPAVGNGTGAGLNGEPFFGEFARFAAICKYDPTIYVGNFKAVDAFGDADGATIALTMIDATHFSFIYPSVLNPIAIVVTVNSVNNVATIAQQLVGTQWSNLPPYNYPSTATYLNPGVAASTGTVSPCAKAVTLSMAWRTGNFGFSFGGPFSLTLTKL